MRKVQLKNNKETIVNGLKLLAEIYNDSWGELEFDFCAPINYMREKAADFEPGMLLHFDEYFKCNTKDDDFVLESIDAIYTRYMHSTNNCSEKAYRDDLADLLAGLVLGSKDGLSSMHKRLYLDYPKIQCMINSKSGDNTTVLVKKLCAFDNSTGDIVISDEHVNASDYLSDTDK